MYDDCCVMLRQHAVVYCVDVQVGAVPRFKAGLDWAVPAHHVGFDSVDDLVINDCLSR